MAEAFTLAEARAILDALKAVPTGTSGVVTVSYAGRTVQYGSMADVRADIVYWTKFVTDLERRSATGSRHRFSVARLGRRA
jgi:hypothetical protein